MRGNLVSWYVPIRLCLSRLVPMQLILSEHDSSLSRSLRGSVHGAFVARAWRYPHDHHVGRLRSLSSEEPGEGSLSSLGPKPITIQTPRLSPGRPYVSNARPAAAGLFRAWHAADSLPEAVRSRNRRTVSRKGHGNRCDIAIASLRLLLRQKIARTQ